MKTVKITIALLTLFTLVSCKVESNNTTEAPAPTVWSQAFCHKYIKVRIQDEKISNAEETTEGDKKGQIEKDLKSDELLLEVSIKVKKDEKGSHTECSLSDGLREFDGHNRSKYSSQCDIVYDIDEASFGTWTTTYYGGGALIEYFDEDTGVQKSFRFRGSECFESE